MIVIGLGNKARHGKDTAAEAIMAHAKKMQYPVMKMSWASALREEVNEAIAAHGSVESLLRCFMFSNGPSGRLQGIPDWVTPTPDAVVDDENPFGKHSTLLQWWGTDYRRVNFGLDYWVEKGKLKLDTFGKKYPNGIVLVPDTRFPNEAATIENYYRGITIQCTRLNQDGTPFRDPQRDPLHPSETGLDNYNWQHKIVSKSAALTGELAITIFEFERGLRGF